MLKVSFSPFRCACLPSYLEENTCDKSCLNIQPGQVALSKVMAGKGKANLKVGERQMPKGRRERGEMKVHLVRKPEASQRRGGREEGSGHVGERLGGGIGQAGHVGERLGGGGGQEGHSWHAIEVKAASNRSQNSRLMSL